MSLLRKLEVTFDSDFDSDSDLFMFSTDPEAEEWKVTLHGRDGRASGVSLRADGEAVEGGA